MTFSLPKGQPPCIHQLSVIRVRALGRASAGQIRTKKTGKPFVATIEAPVMATDGILVDRTAEWAFAVVCLKKSSICLHLGADAFINACAVRHGSEYTVPGRPTGTVLSIVSETGSSFYVAPMIFEAILKSEAIHIRRNTIPVNPDIDYSKIEKRLRLIIDPKQHTPKDNCRMAIGAVLEIQKQTSVLSVMDS